MIELAGGDPDHDRQRDELRDPAREAGRRGPRGDHPRRLGHTASRRTPVAARPGWDGMTAVKNGDIRPIDDILVTRPGPRLVDGLRLLVAAIHPDAARAVACLRLRPRRLMAGWPPAAARSSPPDSHVGRSGRVRGRPVMLALRRGRSRSSARSSWASAWGPSRSRRATRSRSSPTACSGSTSARPGPPATETIVWDLRLPRVLEAMVVGRRAGGRRRDVPGPAPQPARRSVRARHGVRRGARGGDRGRSSRSASRSSSSGCSRAWRSPARWSR